LDCDDEGFEYTSYGGTNKEDDEFDNMVGCLQDIMISEEFEIMQNKFF
jgi:hypothetical protein